MTSQHQGIYCEQKERRHSRSCEGLRWEQHTHIHIGENLWQRGRNSSRRECNSGNSSAQVYGIDFTNGRVSCSKQKGLSIPRLRRTNGIHGWVMAHATFVSKDDRNLRDCQCYLNASNYSHEVELNLVRRFILRIPERAEFWRMEAKLLRTYNVQ